MAHVNIGKPVLTGPDRNFLYQCTINHTGQDQDTRFDVVWTLDNYMVHRQVLAGDETHSSASMVEMLQPCRWQRATFRKR